MVDAIKAGSHGSFIPFGRDGQPVVFEYRNEPQLRCEARRSPMIKIEVSRPDAARVPEGFALWNLGFRPFYLVASIFASLSILLWICQYSGHLPAEFLRSPAWHGHEMLFGYTMAVVAGFLLTAVSNWTGKPTPTHGALMALTALWVAGRVLVLTPFALVAAIANVAFPVALAFGIGRAIVQSGNRRNYFFLVLLVLLSIAVLAFHLSHLDVLPWPERASLQVGLDVVLFIMAVIGGRVIPMFTNNGVPGAQATRNPIVERLALVGVLVLIGIDMLAAAGRFVAMIVFMVALAHAIRLYLWRPHRTRGVPLVWVLHIAYAWIVVYLVLRGLAELGLVEQVFADARIDHRSDRRHDDRHDDPDRAWPYGKATQGRPIRSRLFRIDRACRVRPSFRRHVVAERIRSNRYALGCLLVHRFCFVCDSLLAGTVARPRGWEAGLARGLRLRSSADHWRYHRSIGQWAPGRFGRRHAGDIAENQECGERCGDAERFGAAPFERNHAQRDIEHQGDEFSR